MANVITGLLFKKTKDANGNITGERPFLPKTLSNLVLRKNGKTVEKSISDLENTIVCFDNQEEYQSAVTKGEVMDGALVIIKPKSIN